MAENRRTLNVDEAAKMLGISRAFCYALVGRGEISSLRLGRRIVIPRRALEAMLEHGSDDEQSA